MKKILLMIAFVMATVCANAQIMRVDELEKYAKEKYGDKWTEAAVNISKGIELDKNKAMTFVQVIPCDGQTAEQLYVNLNYWFTATFNDANSVIKLNDKESGVIIASGYMADIAGHAGGTNSYNVSIKPVIRVDIKEGKIRVTYSIDHYDVIVLAGGGIIGALAGSIPTKVEEKWLLDQCYPFAEKDGHHAKKTSSKALVMSYAYSNVLLDKIEEAAKHGLVGNENDNW
ncbi:hypothetical protein DEM91_09590 [Prevotella sp. TCVGH]|jgi:hypothetical protein|uniref:DUF4468 domain-containing protein n=1 Tax=Prevotella sp. TCVGH TaxID=2182433 RepID=UPI00201D5A73|nr:DUF4468 domain-containing protein [Prevotella sp. TCVGH]MCL6748862.1 hypothetical protein [Prevotella sp. TCVGH]